MASNVQNLAIPLRRRVSRRRPRVSGMGVVVALLLIAYYVGMFAIPFYRAIWLSFQNWDFITDPVYVGLHNYQHALNDHYFWQAVRVTLLFTVVKIGLSLILAFFIALGINQLHERIQRIYLGIFYIPVIIPGIVSIILWRWLFLPAGGAFNSVLNTFGIPSQPFMNSTSQALWCIVALMVWGGLGGSTIIFFAGINDIPLDLLEAARLDGAGLWQQTRHIIFPLLRPIMFYEIVVGVIGAVQAFDVFYLMPGPGFSTRTLAVYTYDLGFRTLNLGYGATVSIFIFLLLLAATVFQFRRYMAAQH